MADRQLRVTLVGDSRQLDRTLARSSRNLKEFGRESAVLQASRGALSSFGGKGGFLFGSNAFIGAAAATAVLKAGIDVASNLAEQTSKTNVVFGKSATIIEDWAKTTSRSIGIADDKALEAASSFGALFVNLGEAPKAAAGMSKSLVQLAADMASFNNTSPDESLAALRSGLAGENEPLRRYQVFLNAAAVAQEAMRVTGKTSSAQLTDQDKVLARYRIILEQTARQQGDFARTSGGLANQQRTLAAQTRDLEGRLGSLAKGPLTLLVGKLNDAAGAALSVTDALGRIGKVKIPTITIPFTTVNVGGGDVGGAFGKAAHLSTFAAFPEIKGGQALFNALFGSPSQPNNTTTNPAFTKAIEDIRRRFGPKPIGERVSGSRNQGALIKQLQVGLQSKEVSARLSGSTDQLKVVLEEEAKAIRDALGDRRLKPKDRLALKQALLGITNELEGINRDAVTSAKDRAAKIKQAREDFQQSLTSLSGGAQLQQALAAGTSTKQDDLNALRSQIAEFRKKLGKATSDSIRSQIVAQITDATSAIKQIQTELGDTFKANVLDKLRVLQSKIQANRDLEDAQAKLKIARQIGGPEGIKLASRDVRDALLAKQISQLENARVRAEGKGTFTVTIGTVNLHGVQNAKQLLAELQRVGRTGSSQSRGKHPGTLIGHL